ncbi:MAG: tRNA pseudouridine(38-40) synthase TruA [Candidatus Zixiibacteriota bacterium]
MNYKCIIEYDGTDFCGWQFQPNERTIQGEFEKALKKMAKADVNVTAAGRTDSGVHAAAQVINFKLDKDWNADIVFKGINSLLPPDVLIKQCRVVDDSFNARFDAKSREYRYRIYNGHSALKRDHYWCTNLSIDFSILSELADSLRGSHDFRSFCVQKSQKESNICILTKSFWTKRGKEYTFHVVANRFLHGMVRSLVGTMVRVADGQLTKREFAELFRRPERSARILTSPPQGLCLVKVEY